MRTWWGWVTFVLTGGLNLQIEHHLFPTVNHGHLPYLQPIVRRVCKMHGVPYHYSSSFAEALAKFFAHTNTLTDLSIF
jgi:delta11-fatty-acid desaturase